MSPDKSPSPDDWFFTDFSHEAQAVNDMFLVATLMSDLGDDPKLTAVFINCADSIGGAHNDVDWYCRKMRDARLAGNARPELQTMSDEDFEDHIRLAGNRSAEQFSLIAGARLRHFFTNFGDGEASKRGEQLMAVLGVLRSENDSNFLVIPRDEDRAQRVVTLAKLMDRELMRTVIENPTAAIYRDRDFIKYLLDNGLIDNPRARQVMSELLDEV